MTTTRAPIDWRLRVWADYQLMSDMDAREWGEAILNDAVEKGKIIDYQILAATSGVWGLQYLLFTVDLAMGEGTEFPPGTLHDAAQSRVSAKLNGEIIPDSDVEVRWMSTVAEPPHVHEWREVRDGLLGDKPAYIRVCEGCGESSTRYAPRMPASERD